MTVAFIVVAFLAGIIMVFGILEGFAPIPPEVIAHIENAYRTAKAWNYWFPIREEINFLLFATAILVAAIKLRLVHFLWSKTTQSGK